MARTVDLDLNDPDAGEYFDELPLWSAPFGQLMLEQVPLRRGMTVLDLACGTGFLTLELALRCGDTAVVHAVDPWASAMLRLQRKIDRLGIGGVHLHQFDAAQLDLPLESVDLVVCNLGLNNFDDPVAVLARCRALMRPGATLALCTNPAGHMAEFYTIFRGVLQKRGLLDACGAALEAHVARRGSSASVGKLLDAAGLSVRRSVDSSVRWRFADGGALFDHRLIRLGFLPGWTALVPEAERAPFFAQLQSELDRVAAAQGCLELTVPLLYVEAVRPN
jgi:arsenite methyltransferase